MNITFYKRQEELYHLQVSKFDLTKFLFTLLKFYEKKAEWLFRWIS